MHLPTYLIVLTSIFTSVTIATPLPNRYQRMVASVFPALGDRPLSAALEALSGMPVVRTAIRGIDDWRLQRLEYKAVGEDLEGEIDR